MEITNNFTFVSKFFGIIADFFVEPSPEFQKRFIESFMQLYSTALEKGSPIIVIKKTNNVGNTLSKASIDPEKKIRRAISEVISPGIMCDLFIVKYKEDTVRVEYYDARCDYARDIVFAIGKDGE